MIFLAIIRWLCGYVEFEIRGKFPERFINLTAKNGISLWCVKPDTDCIRAKARVRDYRMMRNFTRRSKTRLKITQRFGVRFLIFRYRQRMGLLVGTVLFVVICQVLSLFIWTVDIHAPSVLSEAELRNLLTENGIHVGTLKSTISKTEIEHALTLKNDNISWISVNVIGTVCSVEISPNLKTPDNNMTEENMASNIKAAYDGVITRIEVRNGTATVVVGQGVVRDMLLVSGIMEYGNGQNRIVASDAKIFAQTQRTLQVKIPYEYTKTQSIENTVLKRSVNIMGLTIPLSLNGTPSENYVKAVKYENVVLFDTFLPIQTETEFFTPYEYVTQKLNTTQAEKVAKETLKLQEMFLAASLNECTILDREYITQKEKDGVVVTLKLRLEENICRSEPLQFMDLSDIP